MRTTILVLGIAVLVVAVLAACRAQDDAADDSASSDNSGIADTAEESGIAAADTTSSPKAATRREPSGTTPDIRRAADSSNDPTAIPEDSIRAMRPELPQVKPGSRPRTWRGFKLPEEMPVRTPIESTRRVEQVPDSVLPADTTKPPKPDR
jgi:hypothetical protein